MNHINQLLVTESRGPACKAVLTNAALNFACLSSRAPTALQSGISAAASFSCVWEIPWSQRGRVTADDWKLLYVSSAGGAGMENAFRLPNISGPILSVAATGEGREAVRSQAPQHGYPPQGLDKEPPPQQVTFTTAGLPMYRGEHGFPPPMYAPLPPAYIRPGMGLLGAGGGAFRHLGPHEGSESYHSAFTPAKKTKVEETPCVNNFSDSHDYDKDGEGAGKIGSPVVKEERPSSISSAGDTNSEAHSDTGELYDCGTPDSEGRSLRKSRKRPVDGHICCPICGLTLRPGEAEPHLAVELDKLDRICRGRRSRDSTPSGRKTLPSPSGRKGKDSPSLEAAQRTRYETYRKIHDNRQSRLAARSRNKKRRVGEETVCPVCSERLAGSLEELSGHVEICLRKQRQGEAEDEQVDVEGDGSESYEEYTWAGQTRIRATTMLEGGFAGQGFQTSSTKRQSEDEGDLNVDGDDSEQYGQPQFSESDLIRLRPEEEGVRSVSYDHLRMAAETVTRNATPGCSQTDMPLDLCRSEVSASTSEGALVTALKTRLKDLEAGRDNRHKCLICMAQYQEPVVSVQCWHVHCRQCWLHTLGAKKLCPQCNMITSPTDLRRIYL